MGRRRAKPKRGEGREKTAVERLLEIFEVLPGLYSEAHLFPLMPEDDAFVHRLLERLADRRVLLREHVAGTLAYWDPSHGFDPRRGVLGSLGRLPLNFPLNKAAKRVRGKLERRLLRFREEIGQTEFSYVPLWRVPAEVALGKGRMGRDFYVHGGNRHLATLDAGRLVFRTVVGEAARTRGIVSPGAIERVEPSRVREEIRPVRVAPAEAAEIVRQATGARPIPAKVELCLLPVWRFEVKHREARKRTRHLWLEATFGTVYREPP